MKMQQEVGWGQLSGHTRGVRGVHGLPLPAEGSAARRQARWHAPGGATISENSAATIGSSTKPARADITGANRSRRPVDGLQATISLLAHTHDCSRWHHRGWPCGSSLQV